MKSVIFLIFTCLVFLLGIFLFKTIFYALGVTLVYIVGTIVFEFSWSHRKSPIFSLLVAPVINFPISVVLALSFYVLLYLPIEFLLTEVLLKTPKIPPIFGTITLIFLIIIFCLIDWKKRIVKKSFWIILLLFVSTCGLIYLTYRHKKLEREYLPKIYRVDREWGIQAQIVKIKGVNFFPVWKKGKVFLGGEEMVIKSWGEELVIVEQSVPTKFRRDELKIIRSDGVVSNGVSFDVRDPDSLKIP